MEINEYIERFIGPINTEQPFGIALWANRPPGGGFVLHASLSEICTGRKPHFFIDDYLPKAIFHRTEDQQEKVNRLFCQTLDNEYSTMSWLSQMMTSPQYLCGVISMLDRVTLSEFVRCLPEKKLREGTDSITASECLHAAAELFVFEQIKSIGLNTIIIPRFAQAIMALHRNISSSPLSAIVTSNLVVETDFGNKHRELWQIADEIRETVKKQSRDDAI